LLNYKEFKEAYQCIGQYYHIYVISKIVYIIFVKL